MEAKQMFTKFGVIWDFPSTTIQTKSNYKIKLSEITHVVSYKRGTWKQKLTLIKTLAKNK
jgi:hypothetical protein